MEKYIFISFSEWTPNVTAIVKSKDEVKDSLLTTLSLFYPSFYCAICFNSFQNRFLQGQRTSLPFLLIFDIWDLE